MRYKVVFAYKGKNFYGYQKQPKLRTVQGEIENALKYINNGKEVDFISSGRTDRGVNAKGQVGHFDMEIDVSCYKLKRAINSNTNDDIHVIFVEEVSDDFHARYSVKKKTYVYQLNMGELDIFTKDYIYQYNRELDVEKMKEAIDYFVGTHNFKNFVSDSVIKDNYERKIYKASIKEKDGIVTFTFVGNGFMQYQVRNMVGTLIKVGKHKIKPSDIKSILESNEYKNLVYCAPACGLCLEEVKY